MARSHPLVVHTDSDVGPTLTCQRGRVLAWLWDVVWREKKQSQRLTAEARCVQVSAWVSVCVSYVLFF